MNVLVYGAGVIGCYLAHVLCRAGNEVTLLARGKWKEMLEAEGLVIHHHLQKNTTTDHPNLTDKPGEERYDVVFVVMQHQQLEAILDDLAKINTPLVVPVGNNLSAPEMERAIAEKSTTPKAVLFGFQSTAGNRENGYVECVRMGGGTLYLGGLHRDGTEKEKEFFQRLFRGTKFRVRWQDDMDGWYKSHLAFILPVAYLCYGVGCDLRRCTRAQRKQLLDAANEGYGLLRRLNIPVRPVGEDTYYRPGLKRVLCALLVFVLAKTKLGDFCASDHCRHAVTEMKGLDQAWERLRQAAPEFPMPSWDGLQAAMPRLE